jgi:hypothetical protein
MKYSIVELLHTHHNNTLPEKNKYIYIQVKLTHDHGQYTITKINIINLPFNNREIINCK